jgi:DNA-binding response OmpR family regulator
MLPAILLVDDEEEILDFLERELKQKYTAIKAVSAKEALAKLETESAQMK